MACCRSDATFQRPNTRTVQGPMPRSNNQHNRPKRQRRRRRGRKKREGPPVEFGMARAVGRVELGFNDPETSAVLLIPPTKARDWDRDCQARCVPWWWSAACDGGLGANGEICSQPQEALVCMGYPRVHHRQMTAHKAVTRCDVIDPTSQIEIVQTARLPTSKTTTKRRTKKRQEQNACMLF